MRILRLDTLTIHRLRTALNESSEVLRVIRLQKLEGMALKDMHDLETVVQTLEGLLLSVEAPKAAA